VEDRDADRRPLSRSPGRSGALLSLAVDAVAAEVVGALSAAGVSPVLLKGAVLAHRLYDRGELRPYGDVDLLVAPRDVAVVERVLTSVGFRPREPHLAGWEPTHASVWERDGAVPIDLHTTLAGAAAEPALVWSAIGAGARAHRLDGGATALVPSDAALALVVALHAAMHGPDSPRPLEDLARALDRMPEAAWREAARLARDLGAMPAFAAGIRLAPSGQDLAHRLELPRHRGVEIAVAARLGRGTAIRFQAARRRARVGMVVRGLVPPRAYMKAFLPLARRGTAGLLAAYAWRPLRVAAALAAAARAAVPVQAPGALGRYGDLSSTRRRLLPRAVAAVVATRIALGLLPFRWVASAARRPTERRRPAVAGEEPRDVTWAVAVAGRRVPGTTCLAQALALQFLLTRRGHVSHLRLGVARAAGDFHAHAWLEDEQGTVLVGGSGRGLTPLLPG
jgi:hypothetical protein